MIACLQNVPAESLSEIIKLAFKGSSMRSIFSSCHVNQAMRRAALSTPDLWDDLNTVCPIYPSIDGPLIPKSKWDLFSFWCKRVEGSVAFNLDFKISHIALEEFVKDLTQGGKVVELVCLDGPPLWTVIKLLTCARNLRSDSASLAYLRSRVEAFCNALGAAPTMEIARNDASVFPLLESLRIDNAADTTQGGRGGYDDEIRSFLALFGMPALRKWTLGTRLVLRHAAQNDNVPQSVQFAFEVTWGQLTLLEATFDATPTDWRAFFGGLRSLETARIMLKIVDPDDTEQQGVPTIIPNLKSLWIAIQCDARGYSLGSVLDGFHLPALKMLLLKARLLTVDCLHRMLRATPVLEEIRLSSIFPTVNLDTYFVDFPIPSERLITHAPHLQSLAIDIPGINQFEPSLRGYVDGMAESGWLEGQWSSGTLNVQLLWIRDSPSMRRVVYDLREYLGLPEVADLGGRGEVNIALRDYSGYELDLMWSNVLTGL